MYGGIPIWEIVLICILVPAGIPAGMGIGWLIERWL